MPASCSYLPGFSAAKAALDRTITRQTETKYYDIKQGTIARLKAKMMGSRNGTCPSEEVFSLSSVDPGVIIPIGCDEATPINQTQEGIDCAGNIIDVETRGAAADSDLCRSLHRGSFAVGVDAYAPTFYSYERRFPTICVDAAMASPKEVKSTLQAIKQDGPRMVINDLDYLMWDLVIQRGKGNTAIAEDVVFGQDRGLANGQFPYAPQSYLNHEFMKRLQQIVMADPNNWGKTLTVEASEHQIAKAIEDDQRIKGIERRVTDNTVPDPFRVERTMMYDGIKYMVKSMADYVGLLDFGTYCTFIRPRHHVHQAGTEHGTVTRPNYEMTRGCTIRCNDVNLDKYEVAHWYLDDAVFFVPFKAEGNVPKNGREEIKDHVYATPTSFKTFDIADHAVDLRANCINDRGQFQQWGMMTRFGLFSRPDRIDFGAILLQPVQRCIELQDNCCPEDKEACLPETKAVSAADRGKPNSNGCEPCDGSSSTSVGDDLQLSAVPPVPSTAANWPELAADVPGEFELVGTNVTVVEGVATEAQFCVERKCGNLGALQIDYTTTDDTAVAGVNYTTTAGALNWADGESGKKCVSVPIIDADIAAALAFTFDITPAGAEVIVGGTAATGTINPTPPC